TSTEWASAFLDRLRAPARREAAASLVGARAGDPERTATSPARDPELAERTEERLRTLDREGTLQRLWARDHTVWSPEPTGVIDRLGCLDLDDQMRVSIPRIQRFTEQVARDAFTSVRVLGTGGSAMAPRVYAASVGEGGLPLRVLDSTVPEAVRAVEGEIDLERTLFIVSSKSGSTA